MDISCIIIIVMNDTSYAVLERDMVRIIYKRVYAERLQEAPTYIRKS